MKNEIYINAVWFENLKLNFNRNELSRIEIVNDSDKIEYLEFVEKNLNSENDKLVIVLNDVKHIGYLVKKTKESYLIEIDSRIKPIKFY